MAEKPKKKPEYKVDIWDLLSKINDKNYKYLASLSAEDKKHINPYMIMRWMSGTDDPVQIIYLNELVAPFIWSISSEHFNLKMSLLGICGNKRRQRFTWIKTNSDKKRSLSIKIVQEYFGYNSRDAEEALSLLTQDDIVDYAEQLGHQNDHIKKIRKEFS